MKRLINDPANVARGIFEEIDELFRNPDGNSHISVLDYTFQKGLVELKKKYTKEKE